MRKWILSLLIVFLWANLPGGSARAADAPKRPSLVVLLVFDQMRGDYLTRWESLFEEGGFRRLRAHGAWFPNAHYPYAITMTAAGHSSLATGCSPNQHGIVGNDWWDSKLGKKVAAVDSDRWILRTWSSTQQPTREPGSAGSPERLQAQTVADLLKQQHPTSKIVSLSVKERSAIVMGGMKADAVYSFDSESGLFGTSSYYGDTIHPWVKDYNDSKPADRWFGKTWEKLRPDLDYEEFSGPDDVAGEGTGYAQGRAFPHPFSPTSAEPDEKFYDSITFSPMGNELLVELAKKAIDGEKLGQRDVPDLLCISFSCNDLVGHTWGPDSQEVLDATLRSDRDVHVLLDELDRVVGKDNYVVAVSADHGVCPLVEILRSEGKDAGRLFAEDVMKAAAAYLNTHFQIEKPFPWFLGGANTWVALNKPAIEDHGLDFVNVERILTEWMGQQEGIAFARSIEELKATTPEKTPFLEAIRRSMYPGRTGDILAVPKEHWFFAFALTGTSHGTPYAYDRHVPVLLYGSAIRPGVHEEQVPPQIIAPTFCHVLGLTPAPTMAEPIPTGLLQTP